jgi:hypothetical protein
VGLEHPTLDEVFTGLTGDPGEGGPAEGNTAEGDVGEPAEPTDRLETTAS